MVCLYLCPTRAETGFSAVSKITQRPGWHLCLPEPLPFGYIPAFACDDLGPASASGEVGELHRIVLSLLSWLSSFAQEMKLAVFFEAAM